MDTLTAADPAPLHAAHRTLRREVSRIAVTLVDQDHGSTTIHLDATLRRVVSVTDQVLRTNGAEADLLFDELVRRIPSAFDLLDTIRAEQRAVAVLADGMAARAARVLAGIEPWPMASGALIGDARALERQVTALFARQERLLSPLIAAAFTQDELRDLLSSSGPVRQAA